MQDGHINAPRLFLEHPLSRGAQVECTREQANYLVNVLRLKVGAPVLVFNGADGEWRSQVVDAGKRRCVLECIERIRDQVTGLDLHYLFAPLKHARLDYMVQKATEMGVSVLQPVLTRRTVVARVNLDRMRANAIEAAEQCGVLRVPQIGEPKKLDALLDHWDATRTIVFCDESADVASPLSALTALKPGPLAVLIGPEGGFDPSERARLLDATFALPVSLGPRIMRADTAAVAALALVNATLGDWR